MPHQRLIYLASCYSVNNADSEEKEYRFKEVCRIAAALMRQGEYLYCPIAHTHPLAVYGELPDSWDFWESYDKLMLDKCDELWVVKMPHWRESVGITAEINHARRTRKPIKFLEYRE